MIIVKKVKQVVKALQVITYSSGEISCTISVFIATMISIPMYFQLYHKIRLKNNTRKRLYTSENCIVLSLTLLLHNSIFIFVRFNSFANFLSIFFLFGRWRYCDGFRKNDCDQSLRFKIIIKNCNKLDAFI